MTQIGCTQSNDKTISYVGAVVVNKFYPGLSPRVEDIKGKFVIKNWKNLESIPYAKTDMEHYKNGELFCIITITREKKDDYGNGQAWSAVVNGEKLSFLVTDNGIIVMDTFNIITLCRNNAILNDVKNSVKKIRLN